MKKYFLFSTIILISLLIFSANKASGVDEKIIYKYGTSTPVYYQDGTNTPVTVPVNYIPKKQEMRGVWVTTVGNGDVNKQYDSSDLSINKYKNEYLDILNTLASYKMNTVVFQVRPMNDAFYQSDLNPWSRYLIGTEGKDPGWDPLAWMVEETHKKEMEFHAWFNPYRVSISGISTKNFAYQHPEYVITTNNGGHILNPGEPAARQFVIDTVMEVAQKYDIDAIHFDDYFYPYAGISDSQDQQQYNLYNPNNLSRDDWRRENVDLLIKGIKDALTTFNQENQKAVQFGISPFGIWANKSSNPLGSNTAGNQSYYTQHADTRKWVKEEWIDYICPQLYWEFNKSVAAYADLVKWWADVVDGTNVNLYIGEAIYRYGTSDGWLKPDQIPNHLLYDQKYPQVKGNIYFTYRYFVNSGASQLISGRDKLKSYYSIPAINPAQKNIDSTKPVAPANLTISSTSTTMELNWDKNIDAKLYAVYRFNENEEVDITNSSKLLDVVYPTDNSKVSYSDKDIQVNTTYKYVVTAFDKAYNESDITQDTGGMLRPTISNTKNFNVEVNAPKPNWLEGVTAKNSLGNDITSEIVVDDSRVKLDKLGTYDLIYTVTDSNGETAKVIVKVYVDDNTLPEFTGLDDITIEIGSNKPDWLEGVSASDNFDGDLTAQIIVDDSLLDLSKANTYKVTYTVTDSNGNEKVVKRNVIVAADGKPILYGIKDIEVNLNSKINYLSGITANDLEDGDITNKIKVDSENVKINKAGTYQITYTVTDSDGNVQTETAKVHVVNGNEGFLASEEVKYVLIFSGILVLFFAGLSKMRK